MCHHVMLMFWYPHVLRGFKKLYVFKFVAHDIIPLTTQLSLWVMSIDTIIRLKDLNYFFKQLTRDSIFKWLKMTLNYQRMVERYPKLNGLVGNLILGHEIFSLLDGRTSKVVMRLLCSNKRIFLKNNKIYYHNILWVWICSHISSRQLLNCYNV